MFDVAWTDPNTETVRQRRTRREVEQSTEAEKLQRRASTSSDSLIGKRRPSILTFLNGSKKDLTRPSSRANLNPPEREQAREEPRQVPRQVPKQVPRQVPRQVSRKVSRNYLADAVDPNSPIQEMPPGTLTSDHLYDRFLVADLPLRRKRSNQSPPGGEQRVQATVIEPKFTSWASQSVSTDSNWSESPEKSHFVQPLSPTSFVTQSTEVTVASLEDLKDSEYQVTVTQISSEGTMSAEAPDIPRMPRPPNRFDFTASEFFSSARGSSPTLGNDVRYQSNDMHDVNNGTRVNLWKAPENWAYPSEEPVIPEVPPPKSLARPAWRPIKNDGVSLPTDLSHFQKSLRRMQAASSRILLERLTEDWTDVADESIRRDLELEKQLWMRTALRTCIEKGTPKIDLREQMNALGSDMSLPEVIKILSLYEDHASTSFLSAINSTTETHHISTDPLSPASHPNIHPFSVPSPTPKLPFATSLFTSIHAFALPSLLPSSSIPTMLKECHRTLVSPHSYTKGTPNKPGVLHLTLLDPSALPGSTGPRLRTWLDSHLLLNLERQFKCMNPCRLFPIWLADAGFASSAPVASSATSHEATDDMSVTATEYKAYSTIKRIRFAAATETALLSSYNRSDRASGTRGGVADETEEELKAVVGRMMWEEMWGGYCVDDVGGKLGGARRWWEDEEIMEECVRMGTTWEFLVISAVKEG